MTKAAVVVERRGDIDINKVVDNHFRYLSEDWKLVVFGTQSIYDKIDWYDQFFLIPDDLIQSHEDFNKFTTTMDYWGNLKYDKILVFHPDSMLLREGIDDFLFYDYCGAPWRNFSHVGGNGGLCIRSVQKCIEVVKRVKYDPKKYGNEDLYFSKFIHKFGGNVAPKEEAMKFSVETLFYPTPIGVHAPEKYLTKEQLGILYRANGVE